MARWQRQCSLQPSSTRSPRYLSSVSKGYASIEQVAHILIGEKKVFGELSVSVLWKLGRSAPDTIPANVKACFSYITIVFGICLLFTHFFQSIHWLFHILKFVFIVTSYRPPLTAHRWCPGSRKTTCSATPQPVRSSRMVA